MADRQQGTFLRFPLTINADGQAELQRDASDALIFDAILSGVQNPQGAAIDSDVVDASRCVNTETPQPDQTGCRVRKIVPHEPSLEELYFAVRRSTRDLSEGEAAAAHTGSDREKVTR